MRKRLRKKKHVGEFRGYGVEFAATVKPGVDFDAFWDDFIVHGVAALGMSFGGGGSETHLKGFVELGQRASHVENLTKLSEWLAHEARIESYQIGPPIDAWA